MIYSIYNFFKTFKKDLTIGLILLASVAHVFFFKSDNKYDIYLLYEHSRYISNIVRDCSIYLIISILLGIIIKYDKNYVPLFIFSLVQIICYFIFYNEMGTLIAIPIYVITEILTKKLYAQRNYCR